LVVILKCNQLLVPFLMFRQWSKPNTKIVFLSYPQSC